MVVLWQPILVLTRKDEGHVILSMEFESFYMYPTQGEVNHKDGQVPKPSVLDDLLGVSSTTMDVDPSSVNGETELNAYIRVQQVVKDTDPLMWWKQHHSGKSSHAWPGWPGTLGAYQFLLIRQSHYE